MKKIFITLTLSLCCLAGTAQSFEGEVTYSNNIISKSPNVTSEQFTAMLGTTENYYIKGGSYKTETNGSFILWQLYVNADNKLYNKFSNSEAILWNDGAANPDSVISMQLNRNITEVLGYKCDELVLNCKTGVQKYYFASQFPVDSKLYTRHLYGNWYLYLSQAHTLPLKIIIDNAQFKLESVAIAVKPMKLDAAMFVLPPGVTLAKSPY